MRLVIVESPFSAGGTKAVMDAGASRPGISSSQIAQDIVNRNIAYARACVADALGRGESPIASHLLLTQPGVLDDDLPDQRERGIEAGLSWYGVADACVVYGDYGISSGMERGIARARKLKVPVEARKLGLPHSNWAADGGFELEDHHQPFGGQGQIAGDGVKTLDEVLVLGAASERRRIADHLILEGTRRELLGDRRGGRALALEGDQIRASLD